MVKQKPIIISLLRALPGKTGGIQKLVFQTNIRLQQEGFDIEILYNTDSKNVVLREGLKIIPAKFPPIFKYPLGKKFWQYNWRVRSIRNLLINRYGKRPLIIIGYWINDILLLAELNKLPNIKTIFEFHSPYHIDKFQLLFSQEYLFLKGQRQSILNINKFVYISQSLFEQPVDQDFIPKEKKNVIRNSYNRIPSAFQSSDTKKDFIILSRLSQSKNITFLIEGLYLYSKKNPFFTCDIYGEGPERDFLERSIKRRGLEKQVILKGYKENPNEFLPNYNFLLSASLMEGLSLSVIESICFGLTPILSNIPSHKEILGKEKYHLIFDLNSPRSFVTILENFQRLQEQEKIQVKKNLQNYVKEEFDPTVRINKIKNMLYDII